jgi:hydroxyethylthiazole kinase-like uncharacterized protein yjeF
MKILRASQIRDLDNYTIENEPIASIDLMERAAATFVDWFIGQFQDVQRPVVVFCGIGNNGGDGLAAARMLHHRFYEVSVHWCQISEKTSEDFDINRERLPSRNAVPLHKIRKGDDFPELSGQPIIIDAIFGSGLNRPVEGYWAELLEYLNAQSGTRVAIDIPSGVFADRFTGGTSFHADYTFSFQLPKLAFFFPENNRRVGEWIARSIGLDTSFIDQTETPFYYLDELSVKPLLKQRHRYDHKGTYGHALLIMGSKGSVGASVLAARGCLRSGAGLVSVHGPQCAYEILQTAIPEAMVSIDKHETLLSEVPDLERYSAVGVGCGIGQHPTTTGAVRELMKKCDKPMVIDADAINILGKQEDAFDLIPKGSMLTPHPKEFERLFGKTNNSFEENELQRKRARELGIYIVLKRAHTAIAFPDGSCYFNSTGNPGMGTGGSGDVLSGILTGLLAQGYSAGPAALLGVYLHGLAGDLAAADLGEESLIAGDLVRYLGKAFLKLKKTK